MRNKILVISSLILLGISFGISKASFLLNFTGISAQSLIEKFSNVNFVAPGNNFGWWIFWLATRSVPPTVITIAGQPGQTKTCTKLVRGLYYNDQRGKRLRPLDIYTLTLLQEIDTGYHQLEVTWWLYTSCDDPYSIFGSITYTINGTTPSYLIAGTKLDYNNNTLISAFADNFQYFNNTTPIGYLRDSYGGIGFVWGELTGHADLINFLNNNWMIDSGFVFSWTDITPNSGARQFQTTTGNTAANTLWNLIVQWTLGLSNSLGNADRVALLGNPQEKTVIYNGNLINNATITNQAKINAEKLCKWKNRNPGSTSENVLCYSGIDQTIDLDNETGYKNKTIIMENGNIIFTRSMKWTYGGLDIFVDKWSIYLDNNQPTMESFDMRGFPSTTQWINSWVLIKGNIIINGLLIWWSPGNETGFTHKLYIQGKFSSLNTPLVPAAGRVSLIDNLFGTNYYDPYINLQNIFLRECKLDGIGSDGSPCMIWSDVSRVPLVIVDGEYNSKLLQ